VTGWSDYTTNSSNVYYYEILRATWLTALGSTILWQVKITDNDNDRSGDSLTKTSSIKTGGTVSDDDTGPPTIMSYDDDGDIIDSDATTLVGVTTRPTHPMCTTTRFLGPHG
jgi:hypothetical protein